MAWIEDLDQNVLLVRQAAGLIPRASLIGRRGLPSLPSPKREKS
jgi:hypothetical protein